MPISQFELLEQRNIARAYNSCIILESMDLWPMPGLEGKVPALFPKTHRQLMGLNGNCFFVIDA